jgi:hypothetical protein
MRSPEILFRSHRHDLRRIGVGDRGIALLDLINPHRFPDAAPAPNQMPSKPQAPSQGAFGAALAAAMKKKN